LNSEDLRKIEPSNSCASEEIQGRKVGRKVIFQSLKNPLSHLGATSIPITEIKKNFSRQKSQNALVQQSETFQNYSKREKFIYLIFNLSSFLFGFIHKKSQENQFAILSQF